MSNEQEQYLQMIGAEVLRQQLEQAQQQPAPVTQAQHSWQIAAARNQAAQQRTIDEAQARQRQADKQGEKEQAQRLEREAEQLEQSTKEQALSEWLASGNLPGSFEKQWPAQYLAIQQGRATSREAQAKERFMARYGGF